MCMEDCLVVVHHVFQTSLQYQCQKLKVKYLMKDNLQRNIPY